MRQSLSSKKDCVKMQFNYFYYIVALFLLCIVENLSKISLIYNLKLTQEINVEKEWMVWA